MVKYLDINEQGNSIKCKVICDNFRETRQVVLFLHGFGGHKDNKAAEKFAETALSKMKKAAVFIFDWPCHGKDVKKKLTFADCDTYLTLVLKYIREEMHVTTVFAYGTSFGGYMVLKYLHDHETNPFKKIALRCPAVSMGEIMYSRIMTEENKELLKKGKDVAAGFDRDVFVDQKFVDDLLCEDVRKWDYLDYADDMMIVHGSKDEIVPIEESRAFAENNVIEFIEVEDADHRFQDLNKMKLAHSHMVDFYLGA